MRLKSRPRVIPVLLIDNQGLYKTKQFKNPEYLGDPVNALKIFNEEGADELCILDISDHSNDYIIDYEYLQKLASEAFMPLSYGGGIKTLTQIKKLYSIGFEKVIINSAFASSPNLIKQAANEAGSQSVVVSIDTKKRLTGSYEVWTENGKFKSGNDPIEVAVKAEQFGAGEILVQSIDRDGMMKGYDDSLIKSIASAVSIPVIACGGAGCLKDMQRVIYNDQAAAAAAGSLFVYYGKKKAILINYPSEKDFLEAGIYIKDSDRLNEKFTRCKE